MEEHLLKKRKESEDQLTFFHPSMFNLRSPQLWYLTLLRSTPCHHSPNLFLVLLARLVSEQGQVDSCSKITKSPEIVLFLPGWWHFGNQNQLSIPFHTSCDLFYHCHCWKLSRLSNYGKATAGGPPSASVHSLVTEILSSKRKYFNLFFCYASSSTRAALDPKLFLLIKLLSWS